MKPIKLFTILLPLVLLFVAFQPSAKGSEWDKKITITIDAPVEVPGVDEIKVVDPGTYVFKVMDNSADRNIVQIWSADESQLITTILAVQDYRPQPADSPIVKFGENVSGAPQAIREVFYPGDAYGWEFVYPRGRALKIAKANNRNVLSKTETSAEPHTLVNAEVNAVTPEGSKAQNSTAANPKPQH
jgi:Tol biopolymer transport system component